MSLDSPAEADIFFTAFTQKAALFDDATYLGAVTNIALSKTNWYWVSTGKKLNFELPWGPVDPNNLGNNEKCLALQKPLSMIDIICYELYYKRFICQSVKFV